jgi:hypothetical protein
MITSFLGSTIGKFFRDHSYWAVKLASGKWYSELDTRYEIRSGLKRPFDWTLDLVDTGDIAHIKELWLFCPPHPSHPFGQTAMFPITEPYTAFQLKVGMVHAFGDRQVVSQLIGRVTNKEEGSCECFLWDSHLQSLGIWHSNIYQMGSRLLEHLLKMS